MINSTMSPKFFKYLGNILSSTVCYEYFDLLLTFIFHNQLESFKDFKDFIFVIDQIHSEFFIMLIIKEIKYMFPPIVWSLKGPHTS